VTKWSVVIERRARKDLDQLGSANSERVLRFLYERVARLNNPQQLGGPLKGALTEHWRYRVGDLRILCRIEDDRLVVLVISVGNRREIYR
jgi:mRNA interferase RelE/StbE